MPQSALTSALNATIITGNGNEGLLLNDMGNTLIKDSITGNIMSLSNGFIPLGMKEHGGILYIASYNPQTKEGELGTIPSPIIAYTYNKYNENLNKPLLISDIKSDDSSKEILIDDRLYKSQIYVLSNHIFHSGDKFIVVLNLDLEKDLLNTLRTTNRILVNNDNSEEVSVRFPQVTSWNNKFRRGWFNIKLFAISNSSENPTELKSITSEQLSYYISGSNDVKESQYWFITSEDLTDNFNINKTRTNNYFRNYPNIKSGRLAIQFEVEKPGRLEYLSNYNYKKNFPQLIYTTETNDNGETTFTYYAAIHGFLYSNGLCPIQPDEIIIESETHELYSYSSSENGYNIDAHPSNQIIIYPKILNEEGEGTAERNNNGYLKTKLSGNPSKQGEAYLSNIYSGDNITDHFIITKYRSLNNTEFANYDFENNDALFFVKLDTLDTDVKLKVTTYTKDFIGTDYVKYDSYYLPTFNPFKEQGGENTVKESEYQYFLIENPSTDTYDIELFRDTQELPNTGENKCFVCDGDDGYIQRYDSVTRQYIPLEKLNYVDCLNTERTEFIFDPNEHPIYNEHSLPEYLKVDEIANLKTWIYPITVHKGSKESEPGIESANPESTTLHPQHGTGWTPGWWASFNSYYNSPWYKIKEYYSDDKLPTYKMPCQPIIKEYDLDQNGDRVGNEHTLNWLLPLWMPNNYDYNNDYWRNKYLEDFLNSINNAKTQALNYVNELGFRTKDFKNNCLFATNLSCLQSAPESNVHPHSDLIFSTGNGNDASEEKLDENFYKPSKTGELHIWRSWPREITEKLYQPRLWPKLKKIESASNGDTDWSHTGTHTATNSAYKNFLSNDFTVSSLIPLTIKSGYLRPYAVGVICAYYDIGGNYTDSRYCYTLAPFMYFLLKSTPGFIQIGNNSTKVLDLSVLNYENSAEYLYTDSFYCNFINKGSSAVTLNYLKLDSDRCGWDNNWTRGSSYIIANSPAKTTSGFTYYFSNKILYNNKEELIIDDSKDEICRSVFLEYTNSPILGIGSLIFKLNLFNDANTINLQTEGKIIPYDGLDSDYYSDCMYDDNIAENYYNSVKCISESINNPYYNKVIPFNVWAIRNIEATNILTTLRCQLFVDKASSKLDYTNKSNYKLDYLISLENNKGLWTYGNTPNVEDCNIELNNLLISNYDPEDEENMTKYDLLISTSTANSIHQNSFLNDGGYFVVEPENNSNIEFTNLTISDGLYVFNLNYNDDSNYSDDSKSTITVIINLKEHLLSKHEHFVVFKGSISNIEIKIDNTTGSNKFYMKNCGLYKVNLDSGTPSYNLKTLTNSKTGILTDEDILSNIVMPDTFCFREMEYDGNTKSNIGCLDVTYEGFLALPKHSYQHIGGVYYLSSIDKTKALYDTNSTAYEFRGDTVPDFIASSFINGKTIRTYE